MTMATALNRVQTAWATGDPLALHREVERLAAEGHSRQSLEDALEALLLAVRATGAGDDTEEIINGVWDRLTGWCHVDQHIGTLPGKDQQASVDAPDGKISAPLSAPRTTR
jgi:hypothetical protein